MIRAVVLTLALGYLVWRLARVFNHYCDLRTERLQADLTEREEWLARYRASGDNPDFWQDNRYPIDVAVRLGLRNPYDIVEFIDTFQPPKTTNQLGDQNG